MGLVHGYVFFMISAYVLFFGLCGVILIFAGSIGTGFLCLIAAAAGVLFLKRERARDLKRKRSGSTEQISAKPQGVHSK